MFPLQYREISHVICTANEQSGFFMMGTFVRNGLSFSAFITLEYIFWKIRTIAEMYFRELLKPKKA